MIEQRQENIQSLSSYGVGLTGYGVATLADVTNYLHTATIALAMLVMAVRLIHDAYRLYRYIVKDKNKE